mmetsp:Transcript_93945/g.251470  ORF Transcript_93945/g.251470 Transcript_93945/m.251470 type:complete len:99 (+) Transcript_93945:687-983(+)
MQRLLKTAEMFLEGLKRRPDPKARVLPLGMSRCETLRVLTSAQLPGTRKRADWQQGACGAPVAARSGDLCQQRKTGALCCSLSASQRVIKTAQVPALR